MSKDVIHKKNIDIYSKEYIEFSFPKEKDTYILKILGYILLAMIAISIGYSISILFCAFIVLVMFIVIYEKIYMFFTVDKGILEKDFFITKYKGKNKSKIPINNLGLKITHDINGTAEISFYDYEKGKKVLFFNANEIDNNKLNELDNRLGKLLNDNELFKCGTYGEIISSNTQANGVDININYEIKKSFFHFHGWSIYVMVIILVLLTLYFK